MAAEELNRRRNGLSANAAKQKTEAGSERLGDTLSLSIRPDPQRARKLIGAPSQSVSLGGGFLCRLHFQRNDSAHPIEKQRRMVILLRQTTEQSTVISNQAPLVQYSCLWYLSLVVGMPLWLETSHMSISLVCIPSSPSRIVNVTSSPNGRVSSRFMRSW